MREPLIGVLAEAGSSTASAFIDHLTASCRRLYGARDDGDFPRLLVLALPMAAPGPHAAGADAARHPLRHALEILDAAGADFITTAAPAALAAPTQAIAGLRAQWLDALPLAMAQLGTPGRRFGVLASRAIVDSGAYQRALAIGGQRWVPLPGQDDIDALIETVRSRPPGHGLLQRWQAVLGAAEAAGADRILLASPELAPSARELQLGDRLIDTTELLARVVVQRWLLSFS